MRPTLPELIDRMATDLEGRLPGADVRSKRSNLRALLLTHAGANHLLYGYAEYVKAQLLPTTAEDVHLQQWAAVWGVNQKQPSPARGSLLATGEDGVTVPVGWRWVRVDGAEYAATASITVEAGEAIIPVEAVLPGKDGNLAAGGQLRQVSLLAGLTSAAQVQSPGLTGGTETESPDSLRSRLLQRIQRPPQGGATADYLEWAEAVEGVEKAWVYPAYFGPGTVGIAVATADEANPLPSAELVESVQLAIDARRPVTAVPVVFAPQPYWLDVQLHLEPADGILEGLVEQALVSLIYKEAEPGGIVLVSHLRAAISNVVGEWDHALVTPAENVTPSVGQLVILRGIEWL